MVQLCKNVSCEKEKWRAMFFLFDYSFQVRIHCLRIQDSGFRNRAIKHYLISRKLSGCYRRSKKIITLKALNHIPSNGQGSVCSSGSSDSFDSSDSSDSICCNLSQSLAILCSSPQTIRSWNLHT